MANSEEGSIVPSSEDSVVTKVKPGVLAGNICNPILLTDVNIAGARQIKAYGVRS